MAQENKTIIAQDRTIAVFDVHLPEHDPLFLKVFTRFIRAYRPNRIVLGGDIIDAEAFSSHGGNPTPPKAVAELNYAKHTLKALRQYAGLDCELLYLRGNHEERVENYLIENAPALIGLDCLTLPALLDLASIGIKWVPTDMQPLRVGSVKILHGHQISSPGQYPARQLAEIWGEPGCTVMCGHFHRDQVYVKLMHPRPCKGIVVGCGRTKNPKWIKGPTTWGHAFAVIETPPEGGASKVTVVDANDGRISYGGISVDVATVV